MTIREKAIKFATQAHAGQFRRDGKDYITHPIAVASIALHLAENEFDDFVYLYETKNIAFLEWLDEVFVVSLLHDTIEDTDVKFEDVEREFGYYIAHNVASLSRDKSVTYFDFIMNISKESDKLPIIVKLADLEHNMSDLSEGSLKDKYRFAHHILTHSL
jgi:GTP pyrophosphokinase